MPLNDPSINHSFLRLEDLLLPPPFPAIVSLLLVLGTLNLSRWGARWVKTENKTPIELAAVFVITTGLLGGFVHALSWAGYASLPVLRGVGWTLAALGILELSKWRPRKLVTLFAEYWQEGSRVERFALTISVLTLVGLFAAALGPAVDVDSLDYHLGVPLDWLRHGGAYPRPDWFRARLVGLGESLNMLGLATGTDGVGAAFQAAGLVVTLFSVTAFAKTHKDHLFAVLFVVACPVIAPLITAQKHQLLPAAALTVALVIIVQRFKTFDLPTAIFAFGCAAFAIASKLSFFLSGSVVVLIGLIAGFRAQRLRLTLFVLASCLAVLAVPIFVRNFVFYGDPIAPFLERWRPGGDPTIIAWVQTTRATLNLEKLALLPWDLAVTLKPEGLHDVLGVGVFGFLLLLGEHGPPRQLLLSALAAFALGIGFGPLIPRFFLEPYLWCAAAVAGVPSRPLKSLFFVAITAQAVVVAAVAVYLGAVLFRGALTQTGRERVMTSMAHGYAEAKWLDMELPSNAVMLVFDDVRYRVFLPRPFFVGDQFFVQQLNGSQISSEDGFNWKQRLTDFVKEKQVTALVTRYPIERALYSCPQCGARDPLLWLANRYGTPLAGPEKFRYAARSPFNRGDLTEWITIRINLNGPPS
jgi:Protein of unknown function (DUF1420)